MPPVPCDTGCPAPGALWHRCHPSGSCWEGWAHTYTETAISCLVFAALPSMSSHLCRMVSTSCCPSCILAGWNGAHGLGGVPRAWHAQTPGLHGVPVGFTWGVQGTWDQWGTWDGWGTVPPCCPGTPTLPCGRGAGAEVLLEAAQLRVFQAASEPFP